VRGACSIDGPRAEHQSIGQRQHPRDGRPISCAFRKVMYVAPISVDACALWLHMRVCVSVSACVHVCVYACVHVSACK
jgi:hypothetical protein